MATSDPIELNSNEIYDRNNSPTQVISSMASIFFNDWVFYKVVDEVFAPSILNGNSNTKIIEKKIDFKLSVEQVNSITLNRNGINNYVFQLHIRICLQDLESTELNIKSLKLTIKVNDYNCNLTPIYNVTKTETGSKKASMAINCTGFIKLNPNIENSITLNWISDKKNYNIGVYIVEEVSTSVLLEELFQKNLRSIEEVKNSIINKFTNIGSDLAVTSFNFSLLCPISKKRISIPARSVNCDHLQCFDANMFISLNKIKSRWMCLICSKCCFLEDLRIEAYFLEIIKSIEVDNSSTEVEILPNGTWRIFEDDKDIRNADSSKENCIISLDTDNNNDDNNGAIDITKKHTAEYFYNNLALTNDGKPQKIRKINKN